MYIKEGGNVFKDADGVVATKRINQTDVKPTVQWLEQLTGLPLMDNMLGSTGQKPTSGDLDLAVDPKTMSKQELESRLTKWAESHGFDPREWIRKSGVSVHFKAPITGREDRGYIQTDFMFVQKPDFSKFLMRADPASEYKGVTRNVLMNSIAKAAGYKLSPNTGLVSRTTNEFVTDQPEQIAKFILNKGATEKDLFSVEAILGALKNDPQRDQKLEDFRGYAEREGFQFESVVEGGTDWLARLRDRIINQGMQVVTDNNSPYKPYLAEDARIEHPEDLVFDYGSKGIKQAIDSLKRSAEEPAKVNTIKWDGKPAIIFGRDDNGQFILTDKGGFNAKGYNGMATSAKDMARVFSNRKGDYTDLIGIYQKLFPLLSRTVPEHFRGFVQADLLFSATPPVKDGSYVFTPNQVTYKVSADTPIGKQIGQSNIGLAVHTEIDKPGGTIRPVTSRVLDKVPGVLALDSTMKDTGSAIDLDPGLFIKVQDTYNEYAPAIDTFLNPSELRNRKITSTPKLMKQYINFKVRQGGFTNMVNDFGPWVTQKMPTQAPRIIEWMNQNKGAVSALFSSFVNIALLKDQLIKALDNQDADIKADIKGVPGHEGYVGAGIKLVDRDKFSRVNFAANNPGSA
tara:strand:- start:9234 stop:11114 length:1881 start_codon:yes stop_codon:yes gene_type:complete